MWGISSAGRAPALHAGGQRFDPAILHHFDKKFNISMIFIIFILDFYCLRKLFKKNIVNSLKLVNYL